MFPITVSVLALLAIIAGLFAFGAIAIPAAAVAKALFIGFAFLLAVELLLGREHHHVKSHSRR